MKNENIPKSFCGATFLTHTVQLVGELALKGKHQSGTCFMLPDVLLASIKLDDLLQFTNRCVFTIQRPPSTQMHHDVKCQQNQAMYGSVIDNFITFYGLVVGGQFWTASELWE